MKPIGRNINKAPRRSRQLLWAGVLAGSCGLLIAPGRAQVEVEVQGTTGSLERTADAATTTGISAHETTSGESAPPVAADSPEAIEAITAANKLVAPRKEVLTPADLTTGTATSPGTAASANQPLVMQGKQLVTRSDGTTEAKAIASGAELIRMLNLVPRKRPVGEREIDDKGAINLFPNEEEVRKLLGENPSVVYRVVVNGTPLPDPMIIPWVKQGRVVEELFDEAVDLLNQGRIDNAREKLLALMTEYPATEQAAQSREILDKLAGLQAVPTPRPTRSATATPTPTPSPTPVDVQVNPNVKISTVLIDPRDAADSRVVIGGRSYGVGDKIRNFPDHKIVSISDDTVIIEVEKQGVTKQFPIPVRPTGSNQ